MPKVTLTEFRGAGERLLFVEDEEGLRCVTAEALRANGYLVDEASGVQQARELLEATSPGYDLALIDVALADGDGFDLAQEISGRYPKLRLLLTTGYTDDNSRLPAIRECGLPLLAKPFSLSGLLTVLRKVLAARPGSEEGESIKNPIVRRWERARDCRRGFEFVAPSPVEVVNIISLKTEVSLRNWPRYRCLGDSGLNDRRLSKSASHLTLNAGLTGAS